ncbi:hypothetical protein [Pseudomonas baetica]|uniref:hypothetical protein n=1 Tax=Pseudomonas baetica TaxID=674054 RepID=UPI002406C211|nr:hypothetical protein [Pseudomonas baetica]MDF9773694.1 transcriptional regulator NrdR family protein [Pseudomonas baetica]
MHIIRAPIFRGAKQMHAFTLIALTTVLVLLSASAIYSYVGFKKKNDKSDLEPFSPYLIGLSAAAFAVLIMLLFFAFVSGEFSISGNMGQVGDFIGGLTNPILSFIGLIVLLRTTMIQTAEARKTSIIMLEQQKLFEQERFESSFFTLLERYEVVAKTNLRQKFGKDRLTNGLRVIQRLRKNRTEYDGLPVKKLMKEVKQHVSAELRSDQVKMAMLRAWKVFNFIENSSLGKTKKEYYFSLLVDAMEPCELVIFITDSFCMGVERKSLRPYKPATSIRAQFFPATLVHDYFI